MATSGGRQEFFQVFKRTREAMGRPDIRLHHFRHTGATMAAQAVAVM